jgi:hypothetical protein
MKSSTHKSKRVLDLRQEMSPALGPCAMILVGSPAVLERARVTDRAAPQRGVEAQPPERRTLFRPAPRMEEAELSLYYRQHPEARLRGPTLPCSRRKGGRPPRKGNGALYRLMSAPR